MTTLSNDIRAALGLDDEARLDRSVRFPAPRSPEGRGLAGISPLSTVVDELLKAPHAAEAISAIGRVPGGLRRWAREPGIFLLELTGLTAQSSGGASFALSEDELVVDARGEASFVRLSGPQVEVVWHLTTDAAELLEVRSGASAPGAPTASLPTGTSVSSLSGIAPDAPIELASPPPQRLTGGALAEAWLEESYAALAASPSILDRAAAVGLMARCYSPRDLSTLTVDEVLSLPSPLRAARAWRASLPRDVQDALVMLAIARSGELVEAFEEVRASICAETPEAARLARGWVEERDRLESILALFGEDAPALREALDRLDDQVAVHHTIWSMLDAWEDDPLLCEVAWREPDAWWGRLCGS